MQAAAAQFEERARQNPEEFTFKGLPIRAIATFTLTVSFHRALFLTYNDRLNKIQMDAERHALKFSMRHSAGRQLRTSICIQGNDEEEVAIYHWQLTELLKPTIFSSPHAAELFSYQGRLWLEQIGQRPDLHVHWDNKTRSIRLYGLPEARTAADRELKAEAERLSMLEQRNMRIAQRFREMLKRELPALQRLQGIVQLQLRGCMGQLFIAHDMLAVGMCCCGQVCL